MIDYGKIIALRVLRDCGIEVDSLTNARGWSNELWFTKDHVVKISSGRFRDSLRHETATLTLLGGIVRCPVPIANGRVDEREWLVMTRLDGEPLIHAWPTLGVDEQRMVVSALGRDLRAIHATRVPDTYTNPWLSDALAPDGNIRNTFHPPPETVRRITAVLRREFPQDSQLIDLSERFVESNLGLFAGTRVLLHADVHFGNLIWNRGSLGWLDFETARVGTPELELESLLRFCRHPELFSRDAHPSTTSLAPVRIWLAGSYPALFDDPDLELKLRVHQVMGHLLRMLHFDESHAAKPRHGLRDLLS